LKPFLILAAAAGLLYPQTELVLLGTGNPNPEPDRSGPALALLVDGYAYLVDAGPGVVRRAAAARIGMDRLSRVFLTHLHSDHTLGLPDLIYTPAVTGRTVPIQIYGPPGTRRMARHLEQAYQDDIRIRLHGLEPSVPAAYKIEARDVRPGLVYKDERVTVTALAVPHGTWKHAYAYIFQTKDAKVVVSGDTTYSPALEQAAAGAALLVHEVYAEKGWQARTPDWRKYHAAFHTSAPDLGKLAAKAKPGKLILYHQLPMGQTPQQILDEIRQHFTGTVVYGNDLDRFTATF
jgi:ribonuclease BN (tRNA processing enzyme)